MNVQGEHRDQIEGSLVAAGFAVPLCETERWYRSALRATGVDFVMILGQPRVRGPSRRPGDQAKVDALADEYRSRAEREAASQRATLDAHDTKVARVVYSTG